MKKVDDVLPVMELFGVKFKGVDPTTTVTCPPLGSSIYKVEIEVTAYRGTATHQTQYIKI